MEIELDGTKLSIVNDQIVASSIKEVNEEPSDDLGERLLHFCKTGCVDKARKLVTAGAPFTSDWIGTSPLHFAVIVKKAELAELLLESGISANVRNLVGRTPLHVAAQKGLSFMVKLLLTYGAFVDATDMLSMTPLHYAAESGNFLCVKILLDYGANISMVNKFGKTAFAIAKQGQHIKCKNAIQEAETLGRQTRLLKVAALRSKDATLRKTAPTAASEKLSPAAKKPKLEQTMSKCDSRVNGVDDRIRGPSDDGPASANTDTVMENESASGPQSPGEMSTDRAIKFLQSHGVSMIELDKETTLSEAIENGHTVRLTDAGKIAFKSTEKMSTKANSDKGPAARRLSSGMKVIIGKTVPDCTLTLSSEDIEMGSFEGQPVKHAMYVQRLKEKKRELLRHLEVIENQKTIKQHELTKLNKQIQLMESIAPTRAPNSTK